MKNYFKKFSIMFVMAAAIMLWCGTNVFAADTNQTIQINNTNLSFNRIIYVDGINGNDATGNGSTEKSYKSIQKAQEVAVDGNAIYIKKGIYDLSATGNGLWETKHKLSFIGEPNGTIIVSDGTKNSRRDNHAAAFETDSSVYNIIFKLTAGNRTSPLYFSFVGDGLHQGVKQYGKFNNCVFIAMDKAGSAVYCNEDAHIQFNNCSFIIPNDLTNSYVPQGCYDCTNWKNCAVSKKYGGLTSTSTRVTSLENVSFSDSTYSITSDGWKNKGTGTNPDGSVANVGVYGGDFAWGDLNSKDESITLDNPSLNIKVNDSQQLTATTTPADIGVKWTSSNPSIATVDSTGRVTGVAEGQVIITATTDNGLTATCTVTVTQKGTDPNPNPEPTETEYIVNTAHAKGDNTNNASGGVSIIFNGSADTTLSVVKTADVKAVWVGDTFTYTIVVTNTSTKTAKAVVMTDSAPNHIDFTVGGITTTQGKVDPSSTSKNIIVNVGDIPPSGTVTIKIPVTVIL